MWNLMSDQICNISNRKFQLKGHLVKERKEQKRVICFNDSLPPSVWLAMVIKVIKELGHLLTSSIPGDRKITLD